MANEKNSKTKKLNYEQSREKLVEIVAQLERGDTTLEQSLALWEEGQKIALECEKWLEGVKQKIDETIKKMETEQQNKL